MIRNRKRRLSQWGWCAYEAANSSFSTSVLAVFVGPYLTALAVSRESAHGVFRVAYAPIPGAALFSYLVSASLLLRLMMLPWIGAWVDLAKKSATSLYLSAYVGSTATIILGLLPVDKINLIYLSFLAASLAWGTSLVFYNALLPLVAQPEELDRVSCYGAAAGYLGGALVLGLHLFYLQTVSSANGNLDRAVRVCLWTSGLWWALLTTVSLILLRSLSPLRSRSHDRLHRSSPVQALLQTLAELRNQPRSILLLVALSLSNCGLQTVIAFTGQFAVMELGIGIDTLAGAILFLQIAAAPFPFLFERLSRTFGAQRVLHCCLIAWVVILVATASLTYTAHAFYWTIAGVALVIASTQALSRSLYSQTVLPGQEARMFSLYDTASALIGWCGPLLFGLTLQFTGRYRVALLSITAFFVVGSLMLLLVPPPPSPAISTAS